jgi:TRAP-type C4-dicarboxylate transport system substrate-binding protein
MGNSPLPCSGDDEADQIKKLEAAGVQVTRPDLAPFRAKMEPAYKRISSGASDGASVLITMFNWRCG